VPRSSDHKKGTKKEAQKKRRQPISRWRLFDFREGEILFRLLHQESSAGALDLTGDFAVKMCCKSGHTTRKDLSALGGELFKEVGILEINRLGGNVKPTAWHATVGAAEIGAALWCLGCAHGGLCATGAKRNYFGNYFVSR